MSKNEMMDNIKAFIGNKGHTGYGHQERVKGDVKLSRLDNSVVGSSRVDYKITRNGKVVFEASRKE